MKWWGYKHSMGTYQAKPYYEPLDIDEARQSPFVLKAVGPFEATGREDALKQVMELTK